MQNTGKKFFRREADFIKENTKKAEFKISAQTVDKVAKITAKSWYSCHFFDII